MAWSHPFEVIDSCAKSGEIERAEHWLQELQRNLDLQRDESSGKLLSGFGLLETFIQGNSKTD